LKFDRQIIAIAGILITIIGLMVSRILISVGMIVLISNAVIITHPGENLKRLLSNRLFLVISSLFLLHLLSGLISEDMGYFVERLRIKLPFLLLPFAFCAIQPFSKKEFNIILYGFFAIIVITSVATSVNYLIDYSNINERYSIAKVMPTPINHIRFSLIAVFALIVGVQLFKENFVCKHQWERYFILGGILFLFVFLHMLAVRSGLFALYIAIIYMIIKMTYDSRGFLFGLLGLLILFSFPFTAYHIFPSFKNKMNYVKYDIESYFRDKSTSDFSDGGRFISIKAGLELGNGHPIFGVGIGDLKKEMSKIYETKYPNIHEEARHIPHNQFVSYYAAFGIVGIGWFLFVFLYPVFYNKNYKNPLMITLALIFFTSFLSEATIEGQIGTAFYLVFFLVLLNHLTKK